MSSQDLTRLHVVREPEADGAEMTLEEVYQSESRYVAHLARCVMGRNVEVDDVVQDVFVALAPALGRMKGPRAIHAWLGTVTVRVARRRLLGRRLLAFFGLDPEPDFGEFVSSAASPERRVQVGRLYRALDALPGKDRIAWTLRHVEGEPLEEVARLAGCSLATAKRRIAAAEAALVERLDR